MNLGDRMKDYEFRYKSKLLPNIPAIARIDGKAFHAFCKGLKRPYDDRLSYLMTIVTESLVRETNANCGYTQSDEISLVFHTDNYNSEIFFDGKVEKMCSVLSSMATYKFNELLHKFIPEKSNIPALFDCRVFNTPSLEEAANYFLWRERDAVKNSIAMAAQTVYSHKELHKKCGSEMQEMLFQKNINWNDYPASFKRGTYSRRQEKSMPFSAAEIEKLPPQHEARINPNLEIKRKVIISENLPILSTIKNKVGVIIYGESPILF